MLAKYIVILSTTYFINIAQIFQQKGQKKSKRVEVQTTRCGICSQLLTANKGTVRLEGWMSSQPSTNRSLQWAKWAYRRRPRKSCECTYILAVPLFCHSVWSLCTAKPVIAGGWFGHWYYVVEVFTSILSNCILKSFFQETKRTKCMYLLRSKIDSKLCPALLLVAFPSRVKFRLLTIQRKVAKKPEWKMINYSGSPKYEGKWCQT